MTQDSDRKDDGPAPKETAKGTPLSPKNLLLTKWTAVHPRNSEKHFVVIRVVEPEPPAVRVEQVELEAVHSKRAFVLQWRDLTDGGKWLRGWK